MKRRHKMYLRLNLMSLIFIVISFISVTLAWFAYSGLADVSTEVGVKAWHIELEKDGQAVSNDIVISISEIYPGMASVNEVVNIKNLGDSDAEVKYKIASARVLGEAEDNYIVDDEIVKSEYVEDLLSHKYPFHIDMNLSKGYVLSKGEESSFKVSVSWPLDSGDDTLDSIWGTAAYDFGKSEQAQKDIEPTYQIRPSIQIIISLTAEQYLGEDPSSDPRYNLGDEVLFDVETNSRCAVVNDTCLKTYVMDVNNVLGDDTVTLLPDPNAVYLNGTYDDYNLLFTNTTEDWVVNNRPLINEDLLKIISTDITSSFLVRNSLSDIIIGKLTYENRMSTEITKAINYSGYYKFKNENFPQISSDNCYWTNSEYNSNTGFAVSNIDENISKIYSEEKTASCNIIPVIIALKTNL